MRKTLFLSTSFSTGGGERIFSMLYRHFSRGSLFVSLESNYDYIGESNRAVSLLPASIKPRVLALLVGFFAYLTVVRRHRPDIVQSHIHMPNVFNVLGALVYGYESQIVVHGFLRQYLSSSSFFKKLWGRTLCCLYRRADVVIAVSKGVEEELHGLNIMRTRLIYNAVDSPVKCVSRVIDAGDFRLLYAGRLHQVKKVDIIIRAVSKVEGVHLTIAGSGPELPTLRSLVADLGVGDRVDLLGFVDDLGAIIDQVDGLVLASEVETFGLTLVEALMAGIPVISSNCDSGPREILNVIDRADGSGIVKCPKYGLLYDVGNADQLSECIELLRECYSFFVPDIDVIATRFSSRQMLKEYESIVR